MQRTSMTEKLISRIKEHNMKKNLDNIRTVYQETMKAINAILQLVSDE